MPQTTCVLIVEADPDEREQEKRALEQEKFRVITADSAQEMRKQLAAHKPDIVLLGLLLPDANGLMLMREIQEHSDAKVIIVTRKDSITDKIIGLELGADDYITKPYDTRELIARVNARLRRQKQIKKYLGEIEKLRTEQKQDDSVKMKFGNWIIDRTQWQVYDQNGKSANLTPREFNILETLALGGNRVLTRHQILDKAWRDGHNATDRAVDIQILRIRRKIGDLAEEDPIIRAVRGVGYQLMKKVEKI